MFFMAPGCLALAIMVGGETKDVGEARPVLSALGANIIHVGAVGSGEVAKLCNNLIAGVCRADGQPSSSGEQPLQRISKAS